MSDGVIPFRPRTSAPAEDEGPRRLVGKAVCGACQHEWDAEALIAEPTHLECPRCHRFWGAFKHAVEPKMAWTCNCGEFLFWLTPDGAMCRRCGLVSSEWADVAAEGGI